jgi:hypothetical protein
VVVAVGYEPFHHNVPTNHRGLFIDFDTQHLFGAKHNPMVSAHHRDLHSSLPQNCLTYICKALQHGHSHNLFTRLRTLLDSGKRDDAQIEILDRLLGDCCVVGEQRCQNTRQAWFTTTIATLRRWHRILQKLSSHFYNPSKLHILTHNHRFFIIPVMVLDVSKDFVVHHNLFILIFAHA